MVKFEDLDVWKRSARLSADIYKALINLKDYGFKDQITRSGLSIPSNIAEGMERESPKECINFLMQKVRVVSCVRKFILVWT
jgi:four helix bundle protein